MLANRDLGSLGLGPLKMQGLALLLSSPTLRMPQEGSCTSQKPGGTRMFPVLQHQEVEVVEKQLGG